MNPNFKKRCGMKRLKERKSLIAYLMGSPELPDTFLKAAYGELTLPEATYLLSTLENQHTKQLLKEIIAHLLSEEEANSLISLALSNAYLTLQKLSQQHLQGTC